MAKRARLNERMPWPEKENVMPRLGTTLSNVNAMMGGTSRQIQASRGSNRSPL
jgi:hypothetical protein